MQYFKVSAAKNNEKIDLIVRYNSEHEARESLHKQGYSILQIEVTTAPETQENTSVFYFEIRVGGEKKTGQIYATDWFKAYRKLVDDLGYEVISLTDKKDATEEEKIYSTIRAKESYLLYKKWDAPKIVQNESNTSKKEVEQRENLDPTSVLGKEITRIQGAILRVSQKLDQCIDQYQNEIPGDKLEKLKILTTQLKQIRHITNIEKLRHIGEACLVKLGELELFILQSKTGIKRSDFLRETNSLLKEIGSDKKIGSDREEIEQKLKGILRTIGEAFSRKEEVKQKEGIDKQSFLYLKNLRELWIYETKLKEIRKEQWKNIFASSDIKKRLSLKARLLKQNISIVRGRIEKKTLSYSKIVKGLSYYTKLIIWVTQSLANLALYSVLSVTFLYQLLQYIQPKETSLDPILFPLVLAALFALIFRTIRYIWSIGVGMGVFLLVTFALQINF